jgi:aminoglycoside phosphotransferase (APT) family kinase protein
LDTALGTALGAAVAELHASDLTSRFAAPSSDIEDTMPWVLSFHYPDIRVFRDLSAAHFNIIKILRTTEGIPAALADLRALWRPTAFVHGDLKWDNTLVRTRSKRHEARIRFVDWEFAGVGDPLWDVGSFLSEFIARWIASIPVSGDSTPDRFLAQAECPLDVLQPAILSFWDAYAVRTGLRGEAYEEAFLRAVQFAGARLIQTAVEQCQSASNISGTTVLTLQVAANVLARPRAALEHLFAYTPGTKAAGASLGVS